MAAPASIAENRLSPEVMALAAKHSIQQELLAMVEITRRVFPNANNLEVYVEEDPDIPDARFIIYDLSVPHLSLVEASEGRNTWGKELLGIFSYPRSFLPVLRLDFAE